MNMTTAHTGFRFSDSSGGRLVIGGSDGNITIGTTSAIFHGTGTTSRGGFVAGFTTGSSFRECLEQQGVYSKSKQQKNLEDVRPPSETTCLHRKQVRVTDLARPSVYILYNNEEVVYVGQSINPYQRMAQHLRDKEFTHIRILICRKCRMNFWEQKLIQAYNPMYNVTHTKKKSGKLRLVKKDRSATKGTPAARRWAARNPWFQFPKDAYEVQVRDDAIRIHNDIVQSGLYSVDSRNYYNELDRRIRIAHPFLRATSNFNRTPTKAQANSET